MAEITTFTEVVFEVLAMDVRSIIRRVYIPPRPHRSGLNFFRDHHPFIYQSHLMFHTRSKASQEWKWQKHACQEFDPYRSFVPGEPGYEKRCLWSDYTKYCPNSEAWRLGKRAYDILTARFGEPPTNEQLRLLLDDCSEIAEDSDPVLERLTMTGVVVVRHPLPEEADLAPESGIEALKRATLTQRLRLVHDLSLGGALAHGPLDWLAIAATCCLVSLDAATCDHGNAETFLDARDFLHDVERGATVHQEAKKVAQERRTQDARQAASKRHAPSRKLRELAEALYAGKKWTSRKQAVRQLLPTLRSEAKILGHTPSEERFPQTVYEWLTAYDKKIRPPADV